MGTVVRGCQLMLTISLKCLVLVAEMQSQAYKLPQAFHCQLLLLIGAQEIQQVLVGAEQGLATWHLCTVGRPCAGLPRLTREVASQPSLLNTESTEFLLQLNSRERKHFGGYS